MALPIVVQETVHGVAPRLCLRGLLRSLGIPEETHLAVASTAARKVLIQGRVPASFPGELSGTMSYDKKHADAVVSAVFAALPEVRDRLRHHDAALAAAVKITMSEDE